MYYYRPNEIFNDIFFDEKIKAFVDFKFGLKKEWKEEIKIGDRVISTRKIRNFKSQFIYEYLGRIDNADIAANENNDETIIIDIEMKYKWKEIRPVYRHAANCSWRGSYFENSLVVFDNHSWLLYPGNDPRNDPQFLPAQDQVLCMKCGNLGAGLKWFRNFENQSNEYMICLNCLTAHLN